MAEDSASGRWRRVRALLDELLPLAPGRRRARLDELCAGDRALRAEVTALLELDEALADERGPQRPPLGWLLEPGGDGEA